jgi:hypothetical protein
VEDELRAWFEAQGLTRYAATADERGEITEIERAPMTALGPRDEDFVAAPHPAASRYPGKPLQQMDLDDYNRFMFRWLEAAVRVGDVRCANCGRLLRDEDDLPASERWDALFLEKELVGWMLVHFDCKRWLAKKLKGVQPFDLTPRESPHYDLSGVALTAAERETHV